MWRLGEGIGGGPGGPAADALATVKGHNGMMKLSAAPKHVLRAKLGGTGEPSVLPSRRTVRPNTLPEARSERRSFSLSLRVHALPPRRYSTRTRATSSFRRARARLVPFGPASSRDDTMCFDRVSRGDTNFTSNKVTDLSEGDARHRRRRPTSLPVHASIVSIRALTSSPRLLSRSPLSQANSSPSATRIASVFSR